MKAKRTQGGSTPSKSASSKTLQDQVGVQSIETGMRLLAALADLTFDGPPPMLKDLAAAAKLPPAKAHRYLVSFGRAEVVERDIATGRYRLGPVARRIGIAAIRSTDIIRLAGARLPELCARARHSGAIAIWTHDGARVIWVEEIRRPVTIGTRVGETLPLLSSATGHVFGAWLPRALIGDVLTRELAANRKRGQDGLITKAQDADALFAQTRAAGIGWTVGGLNPTINALAAPVFDFRGTLAATVALLGPSNDFDANPKGQLAQTLITAAKELSDALGFRPPRGAKP